jgi:hypothetical protein
MYVYVFSLCKRAGLGDVARSGVERVRDQEMVRMGKWGWGKWDEMDWILDMHCGSSCSIERRARSAVPSVEEAGWNIDRLDRWSCINRKENTWHDIQTE